MLFYTGIARTASGVASSYVEDLEVRRRSMRILQDLVEEGLSVLSAGSDLRHFGELLHEAWLVKSSLSGKVTNDRVNAIYADAQAAGAIGGKLLGAGGGGFMLLFVPPDRRQRVQEKLSRLIHVPFKFEATGSQIVLFIRKRTTRTRIWPAGTLLRINSRNLCRSRAAPRRDLGGPARRPKELFMEHDSRIYVAGGDTLIGARHPAGWSGRAIPGSATACRPSLDLTSGRRRGQPTSSVRPEYVFFRRPATPAASGPTSSSRPS